MKKFVLFLGLGLGLLVTQEGFSAKADHPCSDDGYCYIHNATDERFYVFDKNKKWIRDKKGQYWVDGLSPYGFPVPEDAFPIYTSMCQIVDQDNPSCRARASQLKIDDAHCYSIWRVIKSTDPHGYTYSAARWWCAFGSEGKPPAGEKSPKVTSHPSPQKPGKSAK